MEGSRSATILFLNLLESASAKGARLLYHPYHLVNVQKMLHVVRLSAVKLLPVVKLSNPDSLFHGNITVMQSHHVVLLPVIIVH